MNRGLNYNVQLNVKLFYTVTATIAVTRYILIVQMCADCYAIQPQPKRNAPIMWYILVLHYVLQI